MNRVSNLQFPAGNGQWQAVRAPWKKMINGEHNVERALTKWHALDPILVSTPTAKQFLPPVCIPELAQRVHQGMLKRQRSVLAITAAMTLAAFIAWLFGFDQGNFGPVVAAFLLIFIYLAVDYLFVLRDLDRTIDRTLFVSLAYQKGGRFALSAAIVLFIAGLAQLILQNKLGGLVPLVNNFGALFAATESGEWWRYIVGPFIHANAIHWISNMAMLLVAAGLSGIMGRSSILCLIFLAVNVGSVLAVQYIGIGHRPDALLGVSGAIFGLFGWVVGALFRYRARFPHMWLTITWFVCLNVGLAWILVKQTSNVAHISGFVMGLTLGLVGIGLRRNWETR